MIEEKCKSNNNNNNNNDDDDDTMSDDEVVSSHVSPCVVLVTAILTFGFFCIRRLLISWCFFTINVSNVFLFFSKRVIWYIISFFVFPCSFILCHHILRFSSTHFLLLSLFLFFYSSFLSFFLSPLVLRSSSSSSSYSSFFFF